jgi:hypothetical protein
MNTAILEQKSPEQNMLSIAPKDPDEGLVSQYKYAEMIGRSRVYVNRLVHDGVITLFNGKINPEVANQQILENTSPQNKPDKKGARSGTNDDTLNSAKLAEKRLNNQLLEIELKKKQGQYIDSEKAGKAFSNKITAVVRRLQKISKRISPAIALESDRIKCEEMIYNEIKEAVEEFGENIQRRDAGNAEKK